jgi:hypothetical protein
MPLLFLFPSILRAFAKLRTATISVIVSVRPSPWNKSAPNGRIFMKLYFSEDFSKTVEKIKIYYNTARITGTLHGDRRTFWSYLAQFVVEWEMCQTNAVEKIKAYILCAITFFFRKSCRLWDNVEKCRAGQATDDYGACTSHVGCLRLQTHTQTV